VIERQAVLLRRSHQATLGLVEIRSRLLKDLEASMMLSTSLELGTTLDRVAELAVSRLADWCIIEFCEDEGGISRLAMRHQLGERMPLLRQLCAVRIDPESDHPSAAVIRTGRPELLPDVTEMLLESRFPTGEEAELLKGLGTRSAMVVPLVARGRSIGAITMARANRSSAYAPTDLTFVEEFAGRAALAIDNARLYKQAHDAITLRDNFLNVASHELRTPLTSMRLHIDAFARTMTDRAEDESTRGFLARVTTLQRQMGRLERLVDELLDASRIASGHLELRPEEVDLAALVQEVCGRAPEELGSGTTSIAVRAGRPVTGLWDRLHLEEVFTNLLGNAIKYGGGKPIEVCVEASGQTARLMVVDQGIGIAPADQGRIFQQFERAASERHYSGFGLGLWIARQIVEAMGGTISVISEVGKGSTFMVELPRGEKAKPRARREAKHGKPAPQSA
jgi:signal transduction histidine kinase